MPGYSTELAVLIGVLVSMAITHDVLQCPGISLATIRVTGLYSLIRGGEYLPGSGPIRWPWSGWAGFAR
jgi:hypothetical protein